MLPCPLIARAHPRPASAPPHLCVLGELCVEIASPLPPKQRGEGCNNSSSFFTSLLPYLLFGKSFSCNIYTSPRKCCKQKTYGIAKPFRCNTYKNHGGGGAQNVQPANVQRSNHPSIYPFYFLGLTDIPAQRRLLNSFGINPLRTLFIATEGVPPSSHSFSLFPCPLLPYILTSLLPSLVPDSKHRDPAHQLWIKIRGFLSKADERDHDV